MGLKKSYKHTELGVIPIDWQAKKISEFSNPVRGGSPRPAGDPKYFNGNFIPWLTVASLTNIPLSQIYVSETESYLTEEGSHYSRTLDIDTLIIANSGATLGIAKLLSIKCCANDGIAALLDVNKIVDKKYLVYYINTQTKKLREVIATGNGQPNLNTELIGNIRIPLPSTKEEQTAIATALSDADELIGTLEKLIAKKRNIKQGAMQQLMNPKEGWVVKKLGKVCDFYSGGTPLTSIQSYYGGDIKWITSSDLNKTVIDEVEGRITKSGLENSSAKMIKKGTLLVALYGATSGVTAISNIDAAINQAVLAIIPKEDQTRFLFYCLTNLKGWIIATFIQGGQGNLSGNTFKELELPLPDIDEQLRIATVLSDIDTDIEALEGKLEKYRHVKQGMMQNLLTGKIRLI